MKYSPDYIPNDADARFLVEYLTRELNKIAQTLDHPEATAINYGKIVQNVSVSNKVTIDWRKGQKQKLYLTENSTITYIHPEGTCNLMLKIEYTGNYTPTFPSNMLWTGNIEPTWTKTNGAVDVIAIFFDAEDIDPNTKRPIGDYHATASVDSK